MLLIPAAIKKIKEEGRKDGREDGRKEGREEGIKEGRKEGRLEVRKEMKERLQEAYKRFGVDVDGEIGLPDTPEVWRFLKGEDIKPRKSRVDDIIVRSRFRRRQRTLMRIKRRGCPVGG